MKHPDRPAQIDTILNTIRSDYPADVGDTLEAYISDLEAGQKAVLPAPDDTPSWDPDNSPRWSHRRLAKREQHRRERALRKQNDYR